MKLKEYIQSRNILKSFYACIQNGLNTQDFILIDSLFNEHEMSGELFTSDMLAQIQSVSKEKLILKNLSKRDISEIVNLISIAGMALIDIQQLDKTEKNVDASWISIFFDNARMCSDSELQSLWAKILSGEMQKPGFYFKRTIKVLAEMESHELKWFKDFSKYVIDNYYVPYFIINDNKFYPFNQFQSLMDCGLINSTLGGVSVLQGGLIYTKSGNLKVAEGNASLSVYSLTDSGCQLFFLMSPETSPDYIQELIKNLETNKGVKIESIPA